MQNKITLILGRKGSGKSYLANRLSKELDRVIICDPLNEYKGGYIFYTIGEFEHRFPDLYEKKKYRIICKFTLDEHYEDLFDYIFLYRRFTLLVDECDKFASSRHIFPTFKRLISYGRHREIDMILVSRRPYELNTMVRSQSDEIITFKQSEPRDLEYIRYMGFDEGEVATLKPYDYIIKQNE